MLNTNTGSLPVSIPIGVGNGNGIGGNNFFDDIIALAILGMFCGNGYGFGFGGNRGGVNDAYILNTDMAAIESKIDGVNNGLCSLGYDQLSQMQGINNNVFQSANNILNAVKDCCCTSQQNIKDTQYAIATTGAGIQGAIKDCCCENERIAMQNRYESAQNQCSTLQAIDKLGDRIIDYMANDKAQALRDENQALRLAASQQAQNNYLINQLRPAPVPAFPVPSPFYYGTGFGTTIA